jgi:antitoxin PrlF
MFEVIRERSKITSKGQTTVPKAVRSALGVEPGDEVEFLVTETGVSVRRPQEDQGDPVIESFLTFLEADMARHPQNIVAFPQALATRMAALAEGVKVDLDEDFGSDVEL